MPQNQAFRQRAVKSTFLQFLFLTLFCFLFYGNTVPNGYAYDDAVVITENQFTQRGLSGIPAIFAENSFRGSYGTSPTVERYRPLSIATFALENQFFGQNPHISHFNNVLLLGLTSLLLYRLLTKVFGSGRMGDGPLDFPLIATLLFIAHPVHTEVIANIKGRDEIMALAGCLGSTFLLTQYLDTRRYQYLACASFVLLLALLSKENAITFIVVAPLTLYYYRSDSWKQNARALLALGAATIVFLVMRRLATGGTGPLPSDDIVTEPFLYATVSERFATIFLTFGRYLRLLFFPHPLTIDYYPYHIELAHWTTVAVWVSILVYVVAAVYATLSLRRRSVLAYGIVFYLATFSVVSNVPFSLGTFMSERFMFMPSLGFVVIVAWLLSTKVHDSRIKLVVLTVTVLPCLVKTYGRNQVWKNDFTLFTTDARTSGNSIKGNLVAAITFLEESQKAEDAELFEKYRKSALSHAKKTVALYERFVGSKRIKGPSYEHAIMLLGDCYVKNDMITDALHSYERVVTSPLLREKVSATIETILEKSRDNDFKIKSYSELLVLVPDSFIFNYRLGYLYGREKHDLVSATHFLRKSVEIRPDERHALEALSHAYKLSKDYENAARYLERVTAMDPNDLPNRKKLLNLYELSGNQAKQAEVKTTIEQLEGHLEQN